MTVEHHPEPDGETVAAQRLLRACVDLFASQREAQSVAFAALAEAAATCDLRVEVQLSRAPRSAIVRCVLVDPLGTEVVLVRRLELVPATNVPAPQVVQ